MRYVKRINEMIFAYAANLFFFTGLTELAPLPSRPTGGGLYLVGLTGLYGVGLTELPSRPTGGGLYLIGLTGLYRSV